MIKNPPRAPLARPYQAPAATVIAAVPHQARASFWRYAWIVLAAAAWWLLFALPAFAQGAGGGSGGGAAGVGVPDLSSLTSATPANDWSMRMWRSIFGDFATNPLTTLGGPTSLLGSVFLIFNTCVFTLGFAWAMYGIVGGVMATAHEGEVLGRRMSTMWFPIRMVVGIAGMVPIFGGFTAQQALLMFLTTVGIGIGNTMWNGAVDNTNGMTSIMNEHAFMPASATKLREAAHVMFVGNVCMLAQQRTEAERLAPPADRAGTFPPGSRADGMWTISWGTPNRPDMCGVVSTQTTNLREGSSATAYRVGSVNYDGIKSAAQAAYQTSLVNMNTTIYEMARQWYQARDQALETPDGAVPLYPKEPLDQVVDGYIRQLQARLSQAPNRSAINDAAMANMKAVGWFGAGAWFGTFAEVNAAVADASKGPEVVSQFPDAQYTGFTSHSKEVLDSVRGQARTAMAAQGSGSDGKGYQTLLDSAIRDTCAAGQSNWVVQQISGMGGGQGSLLGTATGNCSMGQAIVSAAIRGTAIGSGGGGDGGGSVGLDRQGWVNPIIMMKNMGDYILALATTLMTMDMAAGVAGWVLNAGGQVASAVGKVVSLTGVGSGVGAALDGAGTAATLAGKTLMLLQACAAFLFVLGAAMAVYIPLMPLLNWIGALIAYAASTIEGLAGATLHAMSHLDGDGDGLGSRTQQGYLYWLNAVLRPGLMLIGFFTAMTIMMAIGTLQAQLFLPAMANVQGNSITGLGSIVMFLVVFFVMQLTLISASFNLIYVITDQVLAFLGGAVAQRLGQDTEDKVNNMFIMAARVGPSVRGAMRPTGGGGKGAGDAGGGQKEGGASSSRKPPGTLRQ